MKEGKLLIQRHVSEEGLGARAGRVGPVHPWHVGGRECDGGRVEGEHGATEKPTFGTHGFIVRVSIWRAA